MDKLSDMRRTIFVGAILSVAIGVALGAWLATRDTSGVQAGDVEVILEGQVVEKGDEQRALTAASQRVGFDLKSPPTLDSRGLRLVRIDLNLGLSSNPDPSPIADLFFSPRDLETGPKQEIFITQFPVRLNHPANHDPYNDPNVKVDLGVPGVEAWVSNQSETSVAYTLFVGDRTYIIYVRGTDQIPDQSVFASLASELR